MRYVSHQKIAELLAAGKIIRSAAAGRIGRVVSLFENGQMVKVQFGQKKHTYGVTWFDHGDEVELVENSDGTYTIKNVVEQEQEPNPDGPVIRVHIEGSTISPYDPDHHGSSYAEMLESEYREYQMDVEKMLEWEQHVISTLRPEQEAREKQS